MSKSYVVGSTGNYEVRPGDLWRGPDGVLCLIGHINEQGGVCDDCKGDFPWKDRYDIVNPDAEGRGPLEHVRSILPGWEYLGNILPSE